MDPRVEVPPDIVARAREFMESGREPVTPRDASTVVLMRDGHSGPEVYLLRRHSEMAFAGGAWVFPGGGVDPRDFDAQIGWAGPTAAEWARLLVCDVPRARALVCAAVREMFEESGVLLAGPTPDTVVSDTSGEDWEPDRLALEQRELSFTDFLSRRGLVLRTDLLRFWVRWITPHFQPRRFDTRFFVAMLPEGQVTRDVSTESDLVTWMPAVEAVHAADAKRIEMMPPTYCTTMEIAVHGAVADVLASATARDHEPIAAELVVQADGTARMELPARLVELGVSFGAR